MSEMAPHVKRMVEEQFELEERLGKLRAFCTTSVFAALAPIDQELMQAQYDAMNEYANILARRIVRATGEGRD